MALSTKKAGGGGVWKIAGQIESRMPTGEGTPGKGESSKGAAPIKPETALLPSKRSGHF